MPKRHHRKMKGGFLESLGSLGSTLSSWGSSVSQGATSLLDKTKKATSSATSSLTATAPTATAPTSTAPTSTTPTSTAPKAFGGRKRSRKMRGGFSPNSPTTGLASKAGSFSGQTAQPKNWVGGRTKKHKKHSKKHRHTKRCRH